MYVVTPARMRAIEGRTIEETGIDGLVLMERAALCLAQEIKKEAPRRVLAVCGAGNNGGDAYACARMLRLWGVSVSVLPLCDVEALRGDALKNARICQRLGIPFCGEEALSQPFDAIVDGLFGTGLSRAPEGAYARAIEGINQNGAKVFSVDIPSGVDGETGRVLGCAVRADVTVTFQWAKRGHFLYPGALHTGRLVVADIGIPDPARWEPDDAQVLSAEQVRDLLPGRPRDAHKNTFGHALLVAGSRGMAGAAVLCGTACMRAGVGLLTVCAPAQSVVPYVQANLPVAMCLPLPETGGQAYPLGARDDVRAALGGKTAVGIGPGLGRSRESAGALEAALTSDLPAVVDADALYHLQRRTDLLRRQAETVLTPHPGEMARLLGRPVEDPVADAQGYAREHGCVVLLKGACTVIAAPDGKTAPDSRLTFNVNGTCGMATAGSGDALTGILLALLAQGMTGYDAARAAAYLHAEAGLCAEAEYGTASMTALDLAQSVRL